MKYLFIACTAITIFLSAPTQAQSQTPPTIDAKAWILLDLSSNQLLAAANPDERIEPGALTQLMTAYVAFGAMRAGKIKLDQQIAIAEHAAKTLRTGRTMYLDNLKAASVGELLEGMVVLTANDAAFTLAEAVAGSEENFVAMMNREAQRLNLTSSNFTSATGLAEQGHYSTVRDLALLATAIMRDFPQQYGRYAQKDFSYRQIKQQSNNRLLWLDTSVDGIAAAHSKHAGWSLVSSAQRGPRRLLAVLAGAQSDAERIQKSQQLLNFGFQAYDTVRLYEANQSVRDLNVLKGVRRKIKVGFQRDLIVPIPRDKVGALKLHLESRQPLLAPIRAGDRVGSVKLVLDGKPYGEYPLTALEDVPLANIVVRAWDSLNLWLK